MRKFIRRLSSNRAFVVCIMSLLVLVVGFCVFQTYASLTPEEKAKLQYAELMAEEIFCIDDLTDLWADTAWSYIKIAIPGSTCWTQKKGPLAFDPEGFPKDFLDKMIGYYEGDSKVPVYEVLIYQERIGDRDICFLNSDYKPIYVIECPYGEYCADDAYAIQRHPDLYKPGKYTEQEIEDIIAHLDPARVLLKVRMIPSDRLYDFLLDETRGGRVEEDEKKDGGGRGGKSGGGNNDL